MVKRTTKKINTVEEEVELVSKMWNKLELPEKIITLTFMFLYFYLLIVVIASYDEFDKSSDPDTGKLIFYLGLIVSIITVSPIVFHYVGISTFGVFHILGFIGMVSFIALLWLILETYDKRELSADAYKDPYSMSIYFLLISFSVMYFFTNLARKF